MNQTERKMTELLARGKEKYGVVSVKAEFEAEGTRIDELLRLVDIARRAELGLTVKIGGCEAVRDLLEAKQIGVEFIVAPMVETSYALSKFIKAKDSVFTVDEQEETDFLFNMETIAAFDNREAMFSHIRQEGKVDGVVFGRVDFCGSLGKDRSSIESDEVTDYVIDVAQWCKKEDLDIVVGGAISSSSLESLKRIHSVKLTRFETRKIVFSGSALDSSDIEKGLLNAVHFELLWLTNKQNYYRTISNEDAKRIDMLESRWKVMGTEVV
jgi:hypothetical protein